MRESTEELRVFRLEIPPDAPKQIKDRTKTLGPVEISATDEMSARGEAQDRYGVMGRLKSDEEMTTLPWFVATITDVTNE